MSNEYVLFVTAAGVAAFLLAIGYLAWSVLAQPRQREAQWGTVRIERYNPVGRLLAEEDFEYLSRQPGFRPEMLRRLRTRRAKVFGGYLKLMRRDFDRLHRSLRHLAADAAQDRPELGRALLEQQVLFRMAMLKAEFRLSLCWAGVKPLDLRPMVRVLEAMQTQARESSAWTAGARA